MKYDIAVVGAGPAGAAVARQAALKGLSVIILEKQQIPRVKPCAGLISNKALQELDYELPEYLVASNIKGIKLIDSDFRESTEKTPRVIGKTVKRSNFDAFLTKKAEEAGAVIVDDTKVKDYDKNRESFIVNTSKGKVNARFLVGADGVYSRVAKGSGIRKKWKKWDLGFTLFVDIPCHGSEKNIDPEIAELYGVSYPFSMGWLFHHNDYLNIGIGTSKFGQKKAFSVFHNWLDKLSRYKNLDLANYKVKGYYLPAGGFKRTISKEGVFLVGDAAGFVDSFSGEGIYFALKSGRILVEEIYRGLEKGKVEDIGYQYTSRCYNDFLKEFRLSLVTAIVLGKKNIPSQLVRYNPFLVQHIANIMENTGGYEPMMKDICLKFPALLTRYTRGRLGLSDSI